MIPQEVIEEIVARNDIESVIGSYVSLKRAGSNMKGLCPFHSEKTPSFTVYTADNSFYCFGCGIGGNVITFVKNIEHLDYPDAVEFLAKRAGITVVTDDDRQMRNQGINKARLLQMNVEAARFFRSQLFQNTPSSREALLYFTEKRGLALSTIKHFGLGFAPDSFDAMIKHMTGLGYTKDELVIANLVSKNESGRYYDSFRNRVMFPIIDVSGNVIAFGGRIMEANHNGFKYKNSADTPVFKKSRNLFALNFARNTCSEELILCEGYMDVIALHVAGFTNAVATLGTAITEEQARLMKRYTKKVIISYDSDEAGQKAASKAMKLLGDVGLDIGVIKLPGAKDPDEFIKAYGKEKFSEVIHSSKSKFEYNMDSILSRYDLRLPQDKIDALNELVKLVSTVYFMAEREIYIHNIASVFGIDAKAIKDDVERLVRKQQFEQRKRDSQKVKQDIAGYGDKVNPDFAKAPAIAKAEESVLGLLLLYPDHRKNVFENGLLTEDDFFTELNKKVFSFLKQCYSIDPTHVDDFNSSFTPEEVGRITKMKIIRMSLAENGPSVLLECIETLKETMQKKRSETVSSVDDLTRLLNSLKENNNNN